MRATSTPSRWYRILERESVAVWYTAPTAIRMLMKARPELAVRAPTSRRCASWPASASRSTPRRWSGVEAFGMPFHDNWWQTETGGIMIANFRRQPTSGRARWAGRSRESRPRSCGARARRDASTAVDEPVGGGRARASHRAGRPCSAVTSTSPSAYRRCFADGWYLTGDLACRDEDGYYWFVGRADDVIKTSGHLIGPFEVESVLMEHPAVAEAGVIGTPDPVAGEVVKAFVVLKDGFEASDSLRRELLALARTERSSSETANVEITTAARMPGSCGLTWRMARMSPASASTPPRQVFDNPLGSIAGDDSLGAIERLVILDLYAGTEGSRQGGHLGGGPRWARRLDKPLRPAARSDLHDRAPLGRLPTHRGRRGRSRSMLPPKAATVVPMLAISSTSSLSRIASCMKYSGGGPGT